MLVLIAAAGALGSCETAPYRAPVSPYTIYTPQEMRMLGQRYEGRNAYDGRKAR